MIMTLTRTDQKRAILPNISVARGFLSQQHQQTLIRAADYCPLTLLGTADC